MSYLLCICMQLAIRLSLDSYIKKVDRGMTLMLCILFV